MADEEKKNQSVESTTKSGETDTSGGTSEPSRKIKHRGREIELTQAKIDDLARKGLLFDEQKDALAREREQQKELLELGQNWQDIARANPQRAQEAIEYALGRREAAGKNGSSDDDDTDLGDGSSRKIRELEQQVQQLHAAFQANSERGREDQLQREIRTELESMPLFKGKDIPESVIAATAVLMQKQKLPATVAAGMMASDIEPLIRAQKQAQLDRQEERDALSTESPRGGTPISHDRGAPEKAEKPKDFASVTAFLKKQLRGATIGRR